MDRFKFVSRVSEEWIRLDGNIAAVRLMNAFKMKLDQALAFCSADGHSW